MASGEFHCETWDRDVARPDAIRTETVGGPDPTKWQSPCCPDCGNRLQTVFVGDEG